MPALQKSLPYVPRVDGHSLSQHLFDSLHTLLLSCVLQFVCWPVSTHRNTSSIEQRSCNSWLYLWTEGWSKANMYQAFIEGGLQQGSMPEHLGYIREPILSEPPKTNQSRTDDSALPQFTFQCGRQTISKPNK